MAESQQVERIERHQKKEELKKSLDQHQLEAKQIVADKKQEEEKLAVMNEFFNSIKFQLAEKQKERQQASIKDRESAVERIAPLQVDLHRQKEEKMSEFLHRLEHAYDGVYERKEALKKAAKLKANKEQDAYRLKKIGDKAVAQTLVKEDGLRTRRMYEEEEKKEIEKAEKEQEAVRENKKMMFKVYEEEMKLATEAKKRAKDLERLRHEKSIAKQMADDDTFEHFAVELMEEWRSQGKDVRPIQKVIYQNLHSS
ncbi:hypothetical protein HK102_002523 [Quaeritorhiza haematococci]|nr:hypothetical protein HK102_002523 [Quaeritorhiza haematococci]